MQKNLKGGVGDERNEDGVVVVAGVGVGVGDVPPKVAQEKQKQPPTTKNGDG